MLEPKKAKFRRVHRGNRKGMAMRGNYVAFGNYGLKAVESGWVTARQIEASRIVISRVVRKIGKIEEKIVRYFHNFVPPISISNIGSYFVLGLGS